MNVSPILWVPNPATGLWQTVRKTADETHDNLVAGNARRDAALFFQVGANKTYQIRGRWLSTQQRDDIGANHTMEFPALTYASGDFRSARVHQDDGSQVSADLCVFRNYSGTLAFFNGTDGSVINFTAGAAARAVYNRIDFNCQFRTSAAGTVYLRYWAQAALAAMTMLAGSYIEYAEVAS